MADEEDEKASGDLLEKKIEDPEPPPPPKIPDVELIVDGFGFMPKPEPKPEDQVPESSPCSSSTNIDIVRRYTWKTKNRMTVQVISYGATITSIQVPDRKGNPDDVIAGFDTLEEYMQPRNPYFGATIGRYANTIRDATVHLKPTGRAFMLTTNKGPHHYHGGRVGFDKVNWRSYVKGHKVIMSHVSERFDEGYPGTVMTQITFEVLCDNTIVIEMKCTTNEPTIINMSNCQFYNLAGHHAGPGPMFDHIITINADKYTPTDDDGVVLGERKVVGGTAFDFRVPRVLGDMVQRMPSGGYDVNFCVTQGIEQDLTFQARAMHPISGRVLEVYSNQPGLQFYTGNLLPDPDRIVELPAGDEELEEALSEEGEMKGDVSEEGEMRGEVSEEESLKEDDQGKIGYGYVPLLGKQGTLYRRHGLFSFMPQNYPDAVNHSNFPNSILNPGEIYCHRIHYKFGILLGKYI